MNMTGEGLKRCIGNTIQARKNGEFPKKTEQKYDRISGIQDLMNALEERREIEAASKEVWELQ